MKNSKLKLTTVAVLSALGMTACLNNSDDTTSALAKEDVVTSGIITGFGSVFINGVEYETDNAAFNIDDAAGAESQLEVGMYITLRGSVNADGSTGNATAIEFENDVEGMVLAINPDGTLNVMGQTVTITADTKFESDVATILTADDIVVNNVVEVSGYSSGTGAVYATRIEVKAETHTSEEMEIKGVVSNLTANTFNIGSMVIDHTTAQLEDFGDVALADGMYVEVKSTDGLNQSNALIASKVELEDAEGKSEKRGEGEEVEMEGVITLAPAADGTGELQVNGQTVVLAENVQYEGGSATDLLVETKVDIEGTYDANGNFVVTEVEFGVDGSHEFEGYAEAVNTTDGTITLFDTVIKVDNYTVIEDERDEDGNTPVRYFSLADIAVGDRVEVEFLVDETTGELVATELSRDDDQYAGATDRYVQLKGPVDSFDSNNNPVVSGISIELAAFDPAISLELGAELEIKGTYSAGAFSIVEISAEGL